MCLALILVLVSDACNVFEIMHFEDENLIVESSRVG